MDTQEQGASGRKSQGWLRIAVILSFLFAFTWALPSAFNWFFLATAAYSFFLAWFYSPRQRSNNDFTQPTDSDPYSNPNERHAARVKRMVFLVSGSIFGIFFLLVLVGILSQNTETASPVTVLESEPRKAVREDAGNVDALTNLGNEFYEANEYDSANFYYDRVLQLDSRNAPALYNKGLILYNQQKQEEAFTFFTRAYDGGMRNAFLSHALGYFHDNKGNTTRAIQFYKEALGLDSARAEIYSRLAELETSNAARYRALAEKWKQ